MNSQTSSSSSSSHHHRGDTLVYSYTCLQEGKLCHWAWSSSMFAPLTRHPAERFTSVSELFTPPSELHTNLPLWKHHNISLSETLGSVSTDIVNRLNLIPLLGITVQSPVLGFFKFNFSCRNMTPLCCNVLVGYTITVSAVLLRRFSRRDGCLRTCSGLWPITHITDCKKPRWKRSIRVKHC